MRSPDDSIDRETLLDALARQFPTAKRQTLRGMIADGRVTVGGVRATRASQGIAAGDEVKVAASKSAGSRPAADAARGPRSGAGGRTARSAALTRRSPLTLLAPLRLVHEDDDLLVIDKPAGLLTSTVPKEKRATALAKVRAYVAATHPRAQVGLIHRLDRDASGLLVFSKTHEAYQSLKSQFFHHTVERAYEATVHGVVSPKKGRIETHLIERADGTVRVATDDEVAEHKGQRAVTDYESISRDPSTGKSVLRVKLHTGRKHQIRVHLSHRGWPIVGDTVYGKAQKKKATTPAPADRLMLRAATLSFDHPRTGRRVTFGAT